MDFTKIEPDNAERKVIRGHELPEEVRKTLDYYEWPNPEEWEAADYPDRWGGTNTPGDWGTKVGWDQSFVAYKDGYIDLGNLEEATTPGWDGKRSDSFFSGILIKYARECHHSDVQHYNQCPNGQMETDAVYVAEYMQASTQDWGWAIASEIHKYTQNAHTDTFMGTYQKSLIEEHMFILAQKIAYMLKRWDEDFDTESFMKSATGQK